jgi:hypothetical protein
MGFQVTDTGVNTADGLPIYKIGNRCFVETKDENGNPVNKIVPCPKQPPRPRFPPIIQDGGGAPAPDDPFLHPFPWSGGGNMNLWGDREAPVFEDYAVSGAADIDRHQRGRPLTVDLDDRSVNVIAHRAAPLQQVTLDEMCRV